MEDFSLTGNSRWYKDAIIYEVHVRAFYDSDADGIGDFAGLQQKLDYLEDLGVTALWLLPFYPSPLKDDGYDISNYTDIHAIYGSMTDFKSFVDDAHRHNIRVITELVMNHTSDQHPWFQQARRAKSGGIRDYYVWSDSPEKYKEARIIFKDYETSNWAWDQIAKSYYWHRFYSHQPDLNYDNPLVRQAITKIVDFWLKTGVDGLRVDAVPYLFEREGTNCENLPETHTFVKELRSHVEKRFKNRMLLAEANQWPDEAAAYFGQGDEFHMAFNFPVMPRLFMAIRMEDRFPIIDIMKQTPVIPENCQWATFLRNHDELTLEMVTVEERDYMYRTYAIDPSARINLGIRRRLAPLLSNDRKKIELMNALLFSLPGTPVIYYGDEIGMGDNYYLGDRNGVRTPMQWSPERNAGFSHANPQRLYLPPIFDPEYHYESINVENQQSNTDSLLWWMKRMIILRKHYHAFSRGSIQFIQPENRKILVFLRRYENENILTIANLSRLVQQTQVDLSEFAGWRPVDLFGRVEFTPITENRYCFTLAPYSYFWFSLEPLPAATLGDIARTAEQRATISTILIRVEELFEKKNWNVFETVLQDYLKHSSWYHNKERIIQSCRILDIIHLNGARSHESMILLNVEFIEEETEIYAIPITVALSEQAKETEEYPYAQIARLKPSPSGQEYIIYDATVNKESCEKLLSIIEKKRSYKGRSGRVFGTNTSVFKNLVSQNESLNPVPLEKEQSHSSVVFGNKYILKLFRQVETGVNPELEIGRFLTEKTEFTSIAPLCGAIEYQRGKNEPSTLGILHGYVPNEGDAWQFALDSLTSYFQTVLTHPTVQSPPVPRRHILSLLQGPTSLAKETIGPFLTSAHILGQRTAGLHSALASSADDPAFAPEPFTFMYQTSLYQSIRGYTVRVFQLLRDRLDRISESLREETQSVLESEEEIIRRYRTIRQQKITAMRIRCHGDYHLKQVLYTGNDFMIIDFEGELARPVSERRLKRSPLQDVASMIRSFHYASYNALQKESTLATRRPDDIPVLQQWARYWYIWVSVEYLNGYLEGIKSSRLLPEDPEQLKVLINAFLLEKAVYEIAYELNNRPDWLAVPIRGILELIEAT